MISNTLTATQHPEVLTPLLALVTILGASIIVMGVMLVKMWVRKDSICSFEARHAHLKDDFMQLQVRLSNADSSISNLRAQLRKATSEGENINAITFNCRGYASAQRFVLTGNVERLEVKEVNTEMRVVEHFKDGSKLHSKFLRSDIQGGVFIRYAD